MLDVFPDVSGSLKNRIVKPDSSFLRCSVFQVVALGYCQTTVNAEALSQMMLLGVLSEAFFTTEEGKIESGTIPTPQEMTLKIEQMIDLGYVYKSSTVLETIKDFEAKYVNSADTH
jgi:hypothetical protein